MTLAQQVQPYSSIVADLNRVADVLQQELSSDVPIVQDLVERLSPHRGKMLRPALVLLGGKASGDCGDEHYVMAAVVEMVHLASLVHDDVIDEADSRRQKPSLNRVMGNEGAVLLGDYVMSHAFRLCNSLESWEASRLLSVACNQICLGELMQVAERRNLALTEGQYLDIIAKKTASLLSVCCRFGAVLAGEDDRCGDALARYGHHLGMAFQISDDMLDLVGNEEEMGKSLGRDLEKGELTLPVIHFLANADEPQRAEALAAIGNGKPADVRRLRRLLVEGTTIPYCDRLAREHAEEAAKALKTLPDSEARESFLGVAEFVCTRRI